MKSHIYLCLAFLVLAGIGSTRASQDGSINEDIGKVEIDLGSSREGSRTDAEVIQREGEAITLEGFSPKQLQDLRDSAEKFTFQTEVNRMMKLIINSLYRNKEIFLRELISNASDALDKIRLLSLTNSALRETNPEFAIRIKTDPDNKILHISDSGIGMTKQDLINNLGTIAKSGTAEFLGKLQESASNSQDANDMIGQFGVGFYSGFLVANKIVVTSKHNDDKQHIWESDSGSYSIVEDPRGDTLKRGTTISLYLKDEASDYLEQDTIKSLIKKYSQFINFPIYLWSSKTIKVEDTEEVEDVAAEKAETVSSNDDDDDDNNEKKNEQEREDAEEEEVEEEEEAKVEEASEDNTEKKKKMVDKTIWDWEVLNDSKPIWTLKPVDVEEKDYNEFYRSITKDTQDPLAKVHFVAEGEVSFKSLLYIPKVQPSDSFNRYGTKADNIKLFVRRVFITDQINDMMPNYLSFIRGIVDSDDLPLNVSRENLQQHKLIKVIKKKLIRKVLDMIKKIPKEEYETFWKEYSTNIKLGVIEDAQNRARLAKLLQFKSSKENLTGLTDYVARMKPNQKAIFYIAGANENEVKRSPFVERLTKKGYEVLYLTEAVDEYAISAIPMFDDKKFQNVAKEGFTLDDSDKAKEKKKALETRFEPLVKWLGEKLSEYVSKAQISERLTESPCALVASMFGWTGNMERLAISNAHQKSDDPQKSYYLNQKKTLEINPRHPLIKELLRRVDENPEDETAKDIAVMMFKTATLRSGYMLQETTSFAQSVETLMRKTLGISLDEQADYEDEDDYDDEAAAAAAHDESGTTEDTTEVDADDHDEL